MVRRMVTPREVWEQVGRSLLFGVKSTPAAEAGFIFGGAAAARLKPMPFPVNVRIKVQRQGSDQDQRQRRRTGVSDPRRAMSTARSRARAALRTPVVPTFRKKRERWASLVRELRAVV